MGSPFDTIHDHRNSPDALAEIQFNQVWSPAMVNTTAIAMNRNLTRFDVSGITRQSQVPGLDERLPYIGGIAASLLPLIAFDQTGWSSFGLPQNVPQPGASNLENTFSDHWSVLRRKHFVNAGMQLLFGTKRLTAFTQNNGMWDFTGVATGNAIADFILGEAASFSQGSNRPRVYAHYVIASPYVQDRWSVTRRLTVTGGLRLEYMPPAHAQPGFASVFDPSRFDPAKAPAVNANGTLAPSLNFDPLNGLIINGTGGVPLNFSNRHSYYWAPAVGFAWEVFGNGKMSLRGGYGITYYSSLSSNCDASCTTNSPFVHTITVVRPLFPNAVGGQASPAGAPTLASEDVTNLRDAMIQSYSLSLERKFGGSWFVSLAGAGNIARRMPGQWDFNQARPAPPYDFNPVLNAGNTFAWVFGPYQGYAAIKTATYNSNAYWNALEVSVRHPVGHDLFVSIAYTWQHDLTQGRGTSLFNLEVVSPVIAVQDSYHPRNEYGNSSLNVPQILSASAIWSIPSFRASTGWKRRLLGGWQLSNITTVQSGFSLDPGLATAMRGLATRPNRIAAAVDGPKTVQQWFNTAAFAAPAVGFFGNAAPGSITGPGTVNFDMAFYKDVPLNEHHKVQFRAEVFNILNHANFSTVQTSLGANNFGRVTGARDPRIAEGVLRYEF